MDLNTKRILLPVLICIACTVAMGQSNKEDVDLVLASFGKQKKMLIAEYMQVSTRDSAAFWKLYDEFEAKRKVVSVERLNLIQQYTEHYLDLDDEESDKLMEGVIGNNIRLDNLHKEYFKKFRKAGGGKNAAKLFQLELYLTTVVRLTLMNGIPFIDELNTDRKTEADDNSSPDLKL